MVEKFPINPNRASWTSAITQSWDVEEARTVSGRRRTLCKQTYPSWVFSLTFPHLNHEQAKTIIEFYARMRGKWNSFLYMDYENHRVENAELSADNGKYYCSTNLATIFEPCVAVENLHVFINGIETTAYNEENGVITLNEVNGETPNGIVTATYDYYYLVCFGQDLKVNQIFKNLYSVSLELMVVRE